MLFSGRKLSNMVEVLVSISSTAKQRKTSANTDASCHDVLSRHLGALSFWETSPAFPTPFPSTKTSWSPVSSFQYSLSVLLKRWLLPVSLFPLCLLPRLLSPSLFPWPLHNPVNKLYTQTPSAWCICLSPATAPLRPQVIRYGPSWHWPSSPPQYLQKE